MTLLKFIPYNDKYEDQVSYLCASAYHKNSPFISPLDISLETLQQEFVHQFRINLLTPLLFIDSELYSKGVFELLGVSCIGDLYNFLPQQSEDNKQVDYSIVPTKSMVRLYMRYMVLQSFSGGRIIKKGEWAYGTIMAVSPKYMGIKGISGYIFGYALYMSYLQGYKNIVGHAINDLAKSVIRRASQLEITEIPVNVSNIFILDSQNYPFKGLNLTQNIFSIQNLDEKQLLNFLNQQGIKSKL